jgi:hypothetical protein
MRELHYHSPSKITRHNGDTSEKSILAFLRVSENTFPENRRINKYATALGFIDQDAVLLS